MYLLNVYQKNLIISSTERHKENNINIFYFFIFIVYKQ